MAEDTERRLKRVMDKLYHSPPPKSPTPSFGMGASTPLKRRRWELGSNVEAARSVRRATGEDGRSPCRPWDRGDLMRRLATFKAMTWFGKPKAIDPVNCARRGWVNVQMDTLACQSCGARLLFSNPSSWTLQQVEKAAAVFSLNLDGGHKLLCPWIDNICDEALAVFPPTPAPALIESYKERSTALLRLSALPVISSTVIDFMKCPQLDNFLSQPTTFTYRLDGGMKLISSSESLVLNGVPEADTSNLYHQAHKIISLCGWEPRLVPYVVDYGHESKQSFKRDKVADSSPRILGNQNLASVTSSSAIFREKDDERCDHPAAGDPYDPASVVLECKLCGACVGLWAFITVARPLEIFNLIESPEDGQNDLAACGSDGSTQHQKASSLSMTIGGGPPPTKQHFKPRISLPIVARHFRAAFEKDVEINSHVSKAQAMDQSYTQSPLENQVGSMNIDLLSEEASEILKQKEAIRPHLNGDASLMHEEGHEQSSANTHEFLDNVAEDAENRLSPSTDLVDDIFLQTEEGTCALPDSVLSNSDDGRVHSPAMGEANIFSQDGDDFPGMDAQIHGTTPQSITPDSSVDARLNGRDGVHVAGAMETDAPQPPVDRSTDSQVAAQRTPHQISVVDDVVTECTSSWNKPSLDSQQGDANKFDPIRHHRPFCPWVASMGKKDLPGWKLTLKALTKDESSPLAKPPPLPPPPLSDEALLLPIFEEIKRVIRLMGVPVFFSLDAASTEMEIEPTQMNQQMEIGEFPVKKWQFLCQNQKLLDAG
ncbi:unnamed protein product [Spirodela intermedia]|uniref:C3HC-type domain-containing protein n=1 Tax=Spirodela intermedia TaxID=51605 RepID=A0A7I8LL37_SPIIN|nr:unnamed protein product [Spirodela intermedia]